MKLSIHDILVPLIILVVFALVALSTVMPMIVGAGALGPTRVQTVTVLDKHVDHAEGISNYMVVTDKGVFEVENSFWLGVANADELYGKLRIGETYVIQTEGNKFVNFWYQWYPYITKVEPKL